MAALALPLLLAACATATPPAPAPFAAPLLDTATQDPALTGVRWGLLAVDSDGKTVASIRPLERFIPASVTKLFTSAAVYRFLPDPSVADPTRATTVVQMPGQGGGPPDLALVGTGDAMLADGPACQAQCLAILADQIAATGLREVGAITGDSTWFPDERWGPGWSQEDLGYYFGAPVSALSVNENVIRATVRPGAQPGDPVTLTFAEGDAVEVVQLDATTGPPATGDGANTLDTERLAEGGKLRVFGTLAAGAGPATLRLPVMDPARAAATRLANHLRARGITVRGPVTARYRPIRAAVLPPPAGQTIATLSASPLRDTLNRTNKNSSNFAAEILLRHLGRLEGDGSAAAGLKKVEALMAEAGVPRTAWDLSDGSGMSVYNRVAPTAAIGLLFYAARQPWGAAWRATFPIGGVDGTLRRRFAGEALTGRVAAKTGTLSGVNALAGTLTTSDGRTITFAAFANDRPSGRSSATPEMDAALEQLITGKAPERAPATR